MSDRSSFPYRHIFATIEKTLLEQGSRHVPADMLRQRLDEFRAFEHRDYSDDDVFSILVDVVFYSGFRAATVSAKTPVIHEHFPDFRSVAAYTDDDMSRVLRDNRMIRNHRKIQACVKNAKGILDIVQQYGSFHRYVEAFKPRESFDNLMRLRDDLEWRFEYIGRITAYHLMMDIGLPVLKPDRVVSRIFYRLGATRREDDPRGVIAEGQRFAAVTGSPIRYIDRVCVAYGQESSPELGLDRGICLTTPRCSVCGLTEHCRFFQGRTTSEHAKQLARRPKERIEIFRESAQVGHESVDDHDQRPYPQTGETISKKTRQSHAIQAVINERSWVTADGILARVQPMGLDIDARRIQEHLDFEYNKRKRLRKDSRGRYKLDGDPPNWRTANPDGTPKL